MFALGVKVRLLFEKIDQMRFIGHLDLLKCFQRAFKRANVPVAYTKGYNPHQEVSFAMPLPLGMAGLKECVDIVLAKPAGDEELPPYVRALNATLPAGLKMLDARLMGDGEKSAASALCAAAYAIRLPAADMAEAWCATTSEKEILVMKKTKTKLKNVDIRPDILSIRAEGATIHAILAAGSERNLKPSLLVEHVCHVAQKTYAPDAALTVRTALYRKNNDALADLF